MDLDNYKDLADIGFKLMGVLVALYIAPIKKSIDGMSNEMRGLQDSVAKLNQNMAVMFEKHETKEKEIIELQRDMRTVRDKIHDIVNNNINKIELNELRIDNIESEIKGNKI